jgi:nitroreductase
MDYPDLVRQTRSYRRFHEDVLVSRQTLIDLVDLARYTASARNLQPLKYVLAHDRARNDQIFPLLAWAGYLPDWPGPAAGERPAAYIVMLGDTSLGQDFAVDSGIAAQTIMLGASSLGLGGCMIGSIQREKMRSVLQISASYQILLVLALGQPQETVVIDEMAIGNGIEYWRDEAGVHHVPKRPLADLILS